MKPNDDAGRLERRVRRDEFIEALMDLKRYEHDKGFCEKMADAAGYVEDKAPFPSTLKPNAPVQRAAQEKPEQ
jgi:hypothetical protein